MDIEIPEDMFVTEEEKAKYPDLVLDEKHLAKGLSSSFLGQALKVLYVIQFAVKHKSVSKESTLQMPVLIMTPNISYGHEDPGLRAMHVNPAWNPYSFK